MRSREFFRVDNTSEDSELQSAREQEAGERIAREKKIPEFEDWLDEVDFAVLKQINLSETSRKNLT
ncbi:MAG: hypothetical protein A2719_05255 [Candidatus Ryanbacteria bacterium RIFCSPHIGHO2_01_FULL_45_22]|uniref:Uncharacterized protein n=1 Tax=Candidatus Ryanbacteria bacterium RIFCSPHIGHO2_01_FULL_45_22 TaxID=1802114 RepID=A0A1G2G3I4_9BACT|nr:MAG: hypothetical protein A2719_05255 [Candidatus Ryanbacteria bacterium RIFCSPHIGHO2_01_FULL_45_22]